MLDMICRERLWFYSFFKNEPFPASFCLFSSFQTNITIFTANMYEKCPSNIRCWDWNPQPSEHESPPITTRPGLFWFLFLHTLLEKREQIPIFGVAKTYALCKVDQPFFLSRCLVDFGTVLFEET